MRTNNHYKITIALLSFFLFLCTITNAQSAQDTITLENMSKEVTTYFVHNQMDSFATLWDDNAVFITIAGLVAKGKDKIVDMHALGKYIIDSATNIQLQTPVINFISKDLAITYTVWGGLVFRTRGQKGPIQSGYLTCVVQSKKDGWKMPGIEEGK